MKKWIQGNSGGFTLIDALMAILILSIGLLGMAQLLYGVMGTSEAAARITDATTLAQDKIEELKSTGYAEISAGTNSENNIDVQGNAGGIYTRTTTVDDVTLTDMKIIDVTVSWNWKGNAKSTTLKYIIKAPS